MNETTNTPKTQLVRFDWAIKNILRSKANFDILKLSPEKRRAYDKYWQDMSFEASLVQTHEVELKQATRFDRAEGMAEGLHLGEQKAKLAIARQLLISGVDNQTIARQRS